MPPHHAPPSTLLFWPCLCFRSWPHSKTGSPRAAQNVRSFIDWARGVGIANPDIFAPADLLEVCVTPTLISGACVMSVSDDVLWEWEKERGGSFFAADLCSARTTGPCLLGALHFHLLLFFLSHGYSRVFFFCCGVPHPN